MRREAGRAKREQKERRLLLEADKAALRIKGDLLFEFVLFICGGIGVLGGIKAPPEVSEEPGSFDSSFVLPLQQKRCQIVMISTF